MMSVSKELIDSLNAQRVRRRGEIETYAKLEWRGNLGSLELRASSRSRGKGWAERVRAWIRRPADEARVAPTRVAPVVVHRVRIDPEVELLVSLRAPTIGSAADFGGGSGPAGSLLPADLTIHERS